MTAADCGGSLPKLVPKQVAKVSRDTALLINEVYTARRTTSVKKGDLNLN